MRRVRGNSAPQRPMFGAAERASRGAPVKPFAYACRPAIDEKVTRARRSVNSGTLEAPCRGRRRRRCGRRAHPAGVETERWFRGGGVAFIFLNLPGKRR